jgi:uncharacterized membrane protein
VLFFSQHGGWRTDVRRFLYFVWLTMRNVFKDLSHIDEVIGVIWLLFIIFIIVIPQTILDYIQRFPDVLRAIGILSILLLLFRGAYKTWDDTDKQRGNLQKQLDKIQGIDEEAKREKTRLETEKLKNEKETVQFTH